MSDTSTERTASSNAENTETNIAEPDGEVRFEDRSEVLEGTEIAKEALEAKIPAPTPLSSRTGKVEHLAARRPVTPLDANVPEIKERLTTLRSELTTLVTDFRWGGESLHNTAQRMIPLLNLGPIQQWLPVLIPFILEIDRAGNLVPVWMKIIEEDDPADLPPEANPAETEIGRARRTAILMLGSYKSPDISRLLGKLARDPNSSIQAAQALVKQGSTTALQALFEALKEAAGWAKVDVVEACLSLQLPRLYDFVLAEGLDRAGGLENYIAIPIYRSIGLERYLRGGSAIATRLSQQATLIAWQVAQESLRTPISAETTPIIFERDLQPLMAALFEGARTLADWQHVVAMHSFASLIGRYWGDISRGTAQDERVTEQVYACLPMMPEIERWMNGPGRDILLAALAGANDVSLPPIVKTLGELREPRAFALLVNRLDETTSLDSREQALHISSILDALGRLGDQRATQPISQLIARIINVNERVARPKRRDNLPAGDPDIPASIVLGAALRALSLLGDRAMLDAIIRSAHDFDPFVRVEVLEAIKRLDPAGDDIRSRMIAREALLDPRDSVTRAAIQIIAQYRDTNAVPYLQQIVQTRPELASAAQETLRQLG